MTGMPSRDPLISLWQTAPTPDTQKLMQDLQRHHRRHERQNRTVLAILCGMALLLLFEEASGRLRSHGSLSALWSAGVVASVAWQRRTRHTRLDGLAMDTVRLLKAMIVRAKTDLLVARCLYAGVPLGAGVSYFALQLAGLRSSEPRASHPRLDMLQTGAGVAALVVMMVAGAILARSRSAQIASLKETLRAIESDL